MHLRIRQRSQRLLHHRHHFFSHQQNHVVLPLLLKKNNCSSVSSSSSDKKIVDLRSDTVTIPTKEMLQTCLSTKLGDDVMSEDPTVQHLELYTANLFDKEAALYVPTGTMGNFISILAHVHSDATAAEVIIGANSHLCNYEGGNISTLGGIMTRQLVENEENGRFDLQRLKDVIRDDNDDHYAKTKLLCLENTHNMLGGIAHAPCYFKDLSFELNLPIHIDGARIMNAIVAHETTPSVMCEKAASVSICLSKGLGAPVGTVIVGSHEFIRLARRARKRCGGGMRQVGVIAAMGLYALENNIERLAEDHVRAQKLEHGLIQAGFGILEKDTDLVKKTNIVFFSLPENSNVKELSILYKRLEHEFGVLISGGYGSGGKFIRAVTHMDIDDEGIDRALKGLISICCTNS